MLDNVHYYHFWFYFRIFLTPIC